MKNKTILLLVFLCCFSVMLGACSEKKEDAKIEHQHLTWHDGREKPFGSFDYPEITEEKALDLLKNKFNVKVPLLVQQVKELLKNEVAADQMKEGNVEYTMYVSGDEILLRGYYPLNQGETIRAFALIDLKYSYIKEKKTVRLTSQSLALTNYGEESVYPKDNFYELLASSAKLIDLSEDLSKQSIENFQNDYNELEKRPAGSKVAVYSNDKEASEKKQVSLTLQVGFGNNQELKEIYATIVDYTE